VRFLKRGQQIEGLGERSKIPSKVRGRDTTALDALTAQKTRLVAANVVFPFLDKIRRNPRMPLEEPLGSAEPG